MIDIDSLYSGILNQDRSSLSKAITLVESSKTEHNDLALELIEKISKHKTKSKRLGISGTPGVGKSTFIEAFGSFIIEKGHKVAVLAIDPTSYISGGSILGDKTRMATLSYNENAFVRPTPSSKYLGGVAKKTKETILLCEAFGFDYIIVETVGVGQSEVAVSEITDHFMLLMQPASGDELQGIKRGILELADSIVVNKADGDLLSKAKITKAELDSSIHILRKEKFPILLCSALNKTGMNEIYESIEKDFNQKIKSKRLYEVREKQNYKWLMDLIKIELIKKLDNNESLKKEIESSLNKGELTIPSIAKKILKNFKL